MRTLALMPVFALAMTLAACDAPDPSAFHHRLGADAVLVGTHISGTIGSGEVTNNADAHQLDQLQRNSLTNDIANPGGR